VSQVVPFALSAPAPEKRLVLRVLDLWRRAHDEDELPPVGSLSAAQTGADIDYVYMIDVSDPEQPRFTHIGEALRVDSWPTENVAKVIDCPPNSILGMSSRMWHEIVERRVPVTRGGIGRHRGQVVLYRSIMMPMVDANGRITLIMGAINWRAVEEEDGRPVA
jgi:hypothetical protein